MDTGRSWDPDKKTSGTMTFQQVMKANGIFALRRWWTISRIRDIQHSKGQVRWTVVFWRGKITGTPSISMEGIPTLTCFAELFIQRISSVSTKQSQIGVKSSLDQILGARKTPREIQMKREELKSLVDIPKLPLASGNRMLQKMESFESMPPRSQMIRIRDHMLHLMHINSFLSWILDLRKFLMSTALKCMFNHWVIQGFPQRFW